MFDFKFENEKTHNGIHYSRYIASWRNAGGRVYGRGSIFEDWLKQTQELTDDEIHDIIEMATCGKLELETCAKAFLSGKLQGD